MDDARSASQPSLNRYPARHDWHCLAVPLDGASRLSDKRIESKGEVAMGVCLLIDPGSRVIGLVVGSGLKSDPSEDIGLTR